MPTGGASGEAIGARWDVHIGWSKEVEACSGERNNPLWTLSGDPSRTKEKTATAERVRRFVLARAQYYTIRGTLPLGRKDSPLPSGGRALEGALPSGAPAPRGAARGRLGTAGGERAGLSRFTTLPAFEAQLRRSMRSMGARACSRNVSSMWSSGARSRSARYTFSGVFRRMKGHSLQWQLSSCGGAAMSFL